MRTWTGWPNLFTASRTMVTNAGYSVLAESKRLPLLWDKLSTSVRTLRNTFPECRDPRHVGSHEEEWVFKPAYSNTGDWVTEPSLLDQKSWRVIRANIMRQAKSWVAQRLFSTKAILANSTPLNYCIGIYTVNGKAEGAYVRVSHRPIIDYRERETPLLIEND